MNVDEANAQLQDANSSINWVGAAEIAIATGLGEIPVVGGILSGLLQIFWPKSETNVWDEIKDRVETVVGKAISNQVYDNVQTLLGTARSDLGLFGVITNFVDAVNGKNGQDPSKTWPAAHLIFVDNGALFQQEGYEVLLLPLFAQFVNLHLSLLRDGVLKDYCKIEELRMYLTAYGDYTAKIIAEGKKDRMATNPNSFNYQNYFDRYIKLNVGDFAALWPYFDPVTYVPPVQHFPNPAEAYYTITEVLGPQYHSDNYDPPGALAGDLTTVVVWCLADSFDNYDFVVGTQINYASGSQAYSGVLLNGAPPPNGVDPQNSYLTYFPSYVDVSAENPIVSVNGQYNTAAAVYNVSFVFQSGTATAQIPPPAGTPYAAAYSITPPPGHRLSSIWIPRSSFYYGGAADIVFGFRLHPSTLKS